MTPSRTHLQSALKLLAVALILKVTASVVLGYRDYLQPNFNSDFLHAREPYFFGAYQWAFFTHIASGPLTLLFGLILISERFRKRFPQWHRSLGKIQCLLILLLLTPSGLWMAYHAETGTVAAAGFATLALLTAMCVLLGWRSAVNRNFASHRCWMSRCFRLLCSAVALRLIGGFVAVTHLGVDWSYPLAAWLSWLLPLAAFEFYTALNRRTSRSPKSTLTGVVLTSNHSSGSAATSSFAALEISARR